jgi:hypothetical protein
MSSSSCEDLKVKTKRRPVRASGLALLALSFQTLGTVLLFFLSPVLTGNLNAVTQALFTPTLARHLCMSLTEYGPQMALFLLRRM